MNRRKSIKSLLVGIFGGLFAGNTLKASSPECKFAVNKSSDVTSILSYENKHGEHFQLLENEYGDLCIYRDEDQIMRLHSLKHIENIPESVKSEFDSYEYIHEGKIMHMRSIPNITINTSFSPFKRIIN